MPKNLLKISLFDQEELDDLSKWKEEWKDMPEFNQEDKTSYNSIVVHFESKEDMDKFSLLIGQKLTYKTRSIYYPQTEIGKTAGKKYIDQN